MIKLGSIDPRCLTRVHVAPILEIAAILNDKNMAETYRLISTLSEPQIVELVDLYRNEFWSHDRTQQDVATMLASTQVAIGLVDSQDHLVGFMRVLTDFVYRAFIFDVMVKPTHRNQGLGKQLMDAVVEHPQLQNVEYLGLYCPPERVAFYQRWGFTTELGGLQLMVRPRRAKQPAQPD